jgi:hypothetical protein
MKCDGIILPDLIQYSKGPSALNHKVLRNHLYKIDRYGSVDELAIVLAPQA